MVVKLMATAIKIGASKTTTAVVVPTNPPEQPLDDTFTFRNIFAPSVHPAPQPSTEESSGATTTLHGVWGTGPDDVWVVGERGTILHRGGR